MQYLSPQANACGLFCVMMEICVVLYGFRTSEMMESSLPETPSGFHTFLIDIRCIYHYNENIIWFLFLYI